MANHRFTNQTSMGYGRVLPRLSLVCPAGTSTGFKHFAHFRSILLLGYFLETACFVWWTQNPKMCYTYITSISIGWEIFEARFQKSCCTFHLKAKRASVFISSLRYQIPMAVERWYTCGHLKDCGWLHQNILLNAKPFRSKRPSGPFENFLIFSVQYFIGAIIVETSVGFVMAKGASIMLTLIVGERRCLCRHRMAVCRSIPYQCSSATDYVSLSRTLGYGPPYDCPTGYIWLSR